MIDASNDSLVCQSEPDQPSIPRAVTAQFVHEVKEQKIGDLI